MTLESFAALAGQARPSLDELALALAAELREVDTSTALGELDRLAEDLVVDHHEPREEVAALRALLGGRLGFAGDRDEYDHPDNSMLDLVLARRRGLPISLSVVYVEVARRGGIDLAGVGLPGHYVVGHFGQTPPLLLDPFAGGTELEVDAGVELRAWARTSPPCGCSTTSSAPMPAAPISAARSALPSCVSTCRWGSRRPRRSAQSSSRCGPGSTDEREGWSRHQLSDGRTRHGVQGKPRILYIRP